MRVFREPPRRVVRAKNGFGATLHIWPTRKGESNDRNSRTPARPERRWCHASRTAFSAHQATRVRKGSGGNGRGSGSLAASARTSRARHTLRRGGWTLLRELLSHKRRHLLREWLLHLFRKSTKVSLPSDALLLHLLRDLRLLENMRQQLLVVWKLLLWAPVLQLRLPRKYVRSVWKRLLRDSLLL